MSYDYFLRRTNRPVTAQEIDEDLLALGKKLRCLVYDAQSGEILYQPAPGAVKQTVDRKLVDG